MRILEAAALNFATLLLTGSCLSCRFEQMANEMLANSTVAGQEGTLGNLVASAALQQFGQAALALLVLHRAGKPLSAAALEQEAEDLLQHHFQVLAHLPGFLSGEAHHWENRLASE